MEQANNRVLRTDLLLIGAVIGIVVILLVAWGGVGQSDPAPPTPTPARPTGVTLETVAAFDSRCDAFDEDWSHVALRDGNIYTLPAGALQLTIEDGVALQISPDGTVVAAPGLGVYDLATGNRLFPIGRQEEVVNEAVFSWDSQLVAVAGDGLYEIATGERMLAFDQDDSWFVFTPDNSLLAVAGNGLFDTTNGERLFALSDRFGYRFMRFNADSTLLAVDDVGIYAIATGELTHSLVGEYMQFNAIDPNLVVYMGGVFDGVTGETVTRNHPSAGIGRFFSEDGELLAVGEEAVYRIDHETRTFEKLLDLEGQIPQISPDGSLVSVWERDEEETVLAVFDTATGARRFQTPDGIPRFSPDGSLLAIQRVAVYDTVTGEIVFDPDETIDRFSPDGSMLISRNGLFDVETWQWLRSHRGSGAIEFSPDGSLLTLRSAENECEIVRVEQSS